MAHNTSLEKQEAEARRRRRAELEPLLAPGWRLTYDNRLEAIDTPAGYHARGQTCLLRCERRDCNRRIALDLLSAVRSGLGDTPIVEAAHRLQCGHWEGCKLRIVDRSYPQGVPLAWFALQPDHLLVLICDMCGKRITMEPRDTILRLKRSGVGDGGIGLHQLPGLARRPCKGCGRRKFSADWQTPPAPGTPKYRATRARVVPA